MLTDGAEYKPGKTSLSRGNSLKPREEKPPASWREREILQIQLTRR